jgi:hypothetical protein
MIDKIKKNKFTSTLVFIGLLILLFDWPWLIYYAPIAFLISYKSVKSTYYFWYFIFAFGTNYLSDKFLGGLNTAISFVLVGTGLIALLLFFGKRSRENHKK